MNQIGLLRFERGLKLADAAQGIGVHRQTLMRLEQGTAKPTASTAKALADFYGVPVTTVLGIDDPRKAA